MTNTRLLIQQANFNVGEQYEWLAQCYDDGAVVIFTGKVRNHNLGDSINTLTLEHYPVMTEKALQDIANEARGRWQLQRICIIHRIGTLQPGEEIVFVGVTSGHRSSAFLAAEFIIDYMKTIAPFWKKEHLAQGQNSRWVEARASDQAAFQRW
ncbi:MULTISPECIES: molybdopterin synthase catalytic subunit MoaE [unclassified Arsenophonus]|uniref:molybdopterin synthase catalytic subunit MoaE n=1 Tax=unclassified Arsenophonus TaxID=2627083 RepID=UPI002859519F|nr:molybdopterin synthase catalytic subunit MoaE [Arsenophonus sp.]MDR5610225.1 molybdopterin synthase catalytic subunit MoaE [Arsenophonus sp.]MDR5613998.1 molybdopterin synthase catalytic subunit MoaE [Arsenophonus sp.]